MKIKDVGSCDDCGTDDGPFVHFGGGTMASEDCMICLSCIASAYRGTHSLSTPTARSCCTSFGPTLTRARRAILSRATTAGSRSRETIRGGKLWRRSGSSTRLRSSTARTARPSALHIEHGATPPACVAVSLPSCKGIPHGFQAGQWLPTYVKSLMPLRPR